MKRRDFLKATAALAASAPAAGQAALMREPKSMPPQAIGMLYDSTLCIGCKACMSACKEANDLPPERLPEGGEWNTGTWDTPLDLSPTTYNIIKAYVNGTRAEKDRVENGYAFVKRHCLHCVDPSCVSACPVSAMHKDHLTGLVSHDPSLCIGCRYCVYSCPFGVPRYDYDDPFGQIGKCQLCSHLLAEGGIPACCDVCPTGASLFGPVEQLKAEAQRRLAAAPGTELEFPRGEIGSDRPANVATVGEYQHHLYGDKELGGTQVMYLSGVPFDKLGLPTNVPDIGYPTLSEGVQHTLYKGMAGPALLLGGLVFLARRNIKRNQADDPLFTDEDAAPDAAAKKEEKET